MAAQLGLQTFPVLVTPYPVRGGDKKEHRPRLSPRRDFNRWAGTVYPLTCCPALQAMLNQLLTRESGTTGHERDTNGTFNNAVSLIIIITYKDIYIYGAMSRAYSYNTARSEAKSIT